MSRGGSYKSFMRVLEKWPLDKNKQGKDLGESLRVLFSKNFPSGSTSVVKDEKSVQRQIVALEALISDQSLNSHPRSSKSTFTGLDYETLTQITTTEMMQQASLESGKKTSFLQKLKNSVQ